MWVFAYLCMFSYIFLSNKIEATGSLCGELELSSKKHIFCLINEIIGLAFVLSPPTEINSNCDNYQMSMFI